MLTSLLFYFITTSFFRSSFPLETNLVIHLFHTCEGPLWGLLHLTLAEAEREGTCLRFLSGRLKLGTPFFNCRLQQSQHTWMIELTRVCSLWIKEEKSMPFSGVPSSLVLVSFQQCGIILFVFVALTSAFLSRCAASQQSASF